MLRQPPDILITTPESLFLLLTSRARATLAAVETVIVDEIHAVVGTKRGAHLASRWNGSRRWPAGRCSGSGSRRRSGRSRRSRASWAAGRACASGSRGP
jgi:ATP-dependent Lhr-like helicase